MRANQRNPTYKMLKIRNQREVLPIIQENSLSLISKWISISKERELSLYQSQKVLLLKNQNKRDKKWRKNKVWIRKLKECSKSLLSKNNGMRIWWNESNMTKKENLLIFLILFGSLEVKINQSRSNNFSKIYLNK